MGATQRSGSSILKNMSQWFDSIVVVNYVVTFVHSYNTGDMVKTLLGENMLSILTSDRTITNYNIKTLVLNKPT